MISLTNYDFQWARSELVIIYPDQYLRLYNPHQLTLVLPIWPFLSAVAVTYYYILMWVKQWKINQPWLGMVTIPPIKIVMTGGLVFNCFTHIYYIITILGTHHLKINIWSPWGSSRAPVFRIANIHNSWVPTSHTQAFMAAQNIVLCMKYRLK